MRPAPSGRRQRRARPVVAVAAGLASAGFGAAACRPEPPIDVPGAVQLLTRHHERYPRMQIADLYKLIHQATFGGEHAVPDPDRARQQLIREAVGLTTESAERGRAAPEPLIEPLTPDGAIFRVHLRPYLAAGGRLESLLDAFVSTANGYAGSPRRMRAYWGVARRLAIEGRLPFRADRLDDFLAAREAAGFPAVHHSEAFVNSYRPAYRVVGRDFVSDELAGVLGLTNP